MNSNQNTTSKLPQKPLGDTTVAALGFGLMGMSFGYKHDDTPEVAEQKHLELLTQAADAGATFWDTSDVYGPFTNEELVGKWFKQTGRRKEIFLATKFANTIDPQTFKMTIRGDKEYVKQAIEGSLKRLGTDYVDLYYQHRVDKNVRIEETVEAMAELVKEGKVRYLGLSECSARTLRRAHKVHPIAACQLEYSMFTLDIERPEVGLKEACEELGVTIVAYSPLSKGLLTGELKSRSDLKEGDVRLILPRFSEENFGKNLDVVNLIVKLAEKKGCTSGQLAIAWLLRQGNVIPLFGTRQKKHFEENLRALNVNLTEEEMQQIREFAVNADVRGERYPPELLAKSYLDTI